MAEAKHAFVDDYPYLVYSPNAETTSEGGSGGGGGGDTSIFRITENIETGALSEKAGDLATMCDSGLVYKSSGSSENGYTMSLLVNANAEQGSYSFAFAEFSVMGEEPVSFTIYKASSANDYPVYDEG